jgi:GNAT superfamily N-acetyltransferase
MPVFAIRNANPTDSKAIGLIHTRSWQDIYRGHFPDEFLDSIDPELRAKTWHNAITDCIGMTFVAELDGLVIGFLHLMKSRDDDALVGTDELTSIYLDPALWRQGFGRKLLNRSKTYAAGCSTKKITLWVLKENTQARAFYESNGFHCDGTSKQDSLPNSSFSFTEVRYAYNCEK